MIRIAQKGNSMREHGGQSIRRFATGQGKHLFSALPALALAAVILLSGCGAAGGPQATPVPPTKTPKPTFTPTTVSVPTRLIIPTATSPATVVPAKALATATPEATAEPPTATPQQAAQFTANQGMNVRSGPGTGYPAIGQLKAGDNYKIMAKNQDGSWVQFNYQGDPGWANSGLVTLAGNIEGVQVAENIPAAPTPRPVVVQRPAPAPKPAQPAPQPAQPAQPAQPQYPFQLIESSPNCQPNEGTTYFNGVVRYRNNSLRNGVCVHIAFYGPRQTKCSGCGGVGDGNWGFSPFGGGKPPKGTTVEIYVVSCQGVPESGQTEATGFADVTPKSNKWIHTLNGGEQCTGITFVGD